ncbi:hypothetical protein [Mesorhizobium sp. BHbdii]
MAKAEKVERRLARQARSLLRKLATREGFVAEVLEELGESGRVALIGGALRELRYAPVRHFRSDLDFVVEVRKQDAWKRLVERRCAKPNKFGGFRVSYHHIDIDFWDVTCSWAHTSGYKAVNNLEDVLDTTFFNVDAMIYLLDENKVHAKVGTLEDLDRRFLDINLCPNPNPLGASVRALRRMYELDMRASSNLVQYIASQIDAVGWAKIVMVDRAAYPDRPSLGWINDLHPRSGRDFTDLMRWTENKIPKVQQLALPL